MSQNIYGNNPLSIEVILNLLAGGPAIVYDAETTIVVTDSDNGAEHSLHPGEYFDGSPVLVAGDDFVGDLPASVEVPCPSGEHTHRFIQCGEERHYHPAS